jgi:DNA-binding Lrp family transcriptional regulator
MDEMNDAIIKYLKDNGEQFDKDLAEVLHIPVEELRKKVAELSAQGDIICCKVTRYLEGKKIEGLSCRLSCDLPMPARGRKAGTKKASSATIFLLD